MNHRRRLVALSAATLVFALPLAGCGGYGETTTGSSTASTTGQPATTGAVTSAGPTATTGDVSSTGQTATTGDVSSTGQTATTGDVSSTGQTATSSGAGGATSSTGGGTSTTGSVDAPCDNVTACGGDVVGTWAVAGSCLPVSGVSDLAGFGLNCVDAPVTGSLEVSGMLTMNADGTLMDNTTMTGETVFELSADCLLVSGTVTSCNRVGGPIEESLGYSMVECLDDAATGGCTCTGTVDQTGGIAFLSYEASESGNYTTADTTITLSSSGDDVEYGYCVEETTLTMTPLTVNRIGTVMGTVVLLKQ